MWLLVSSHGPTSDRSSLGEGEGCPQHPPLLPAPTPLAILFSHKLSLGAPLPLPVPLSTPCSPSPGSLPRASQGARSSQTVGKHSPGLGQLLVPGTPR